MREWFGTETKDKHRQDFERQSVRYELRRYRDELFRVS
ncbi:hypothetical protein CKA32_002177 [Geitlerinema sp. FC II]|nr:hypothetical protein CKA32_002177 [Geitlerinema sp. FC II]